MRQLLRAEERQFLLDCATGDGTAIRGTQFAYLFDYGLVYQANTRRGLRYRLTPTGQDALTRGWY